MSPYEAKRLILAGTAPAHLTVSGSLWLSGCTGLNALPENLTVSGSLGLDGCTGLNALPENLTVSGDLWLDGCTGLNALPENLTVSGDLYVSAPALYLVGVEIRCRSIRPIEDDREYWEGRLGISLNGCWGEVYAATRNQMRQLLATPGLEEWELVVLRGFRG
jgi:hypothetical protein